MSLKIKNSHIHLDIVGGIAGDMFISAMLDMFTPLKSDVFNAVNGVLPDGTGKPVLSEGLNAGISGLRFKLETPEMTSGENESFGHEHSHAHEDKHSHSHNHCEPHVHSSDHSHEHYHKHKHSHAEHQEHTDNHSHSHHEHTTYQHLCGLMENSELDESVKNIAIELLTIIAKAEAKIHAKTLADVHFHELADWDSLMDVVASAVILNTLAQCSWSTSTLPLGGGLVDTQHGLIPVPAPATAEILIGFEFFDDGIQGERITPTGAAILRYLSNNSLLTTRQQGHLENTGYGLGTKVFPGMPNILRATIFDLVGSKKCSGLENNTQDTQQGSVVIIEFDIDDMTGEELGLSMELIRSYEGVVDVVSQSARGKKNRAVELIRVMAESTHYQNIIAYCFLQTTTIGLRYRFETRSFLLREHGVVNGDAYKSVQRPDGIETTKIEHDQLTSLPTLNDRRMKKYKIESS